MQTGRRPAGRAWSRARVLDMHLEVIKDLRGTVEPRPHRPLGASHPLSSFTECPLRLTAANSHLNLGHIDLGLRPKPSPRGSRADRPAEMLKYLPVPPPSSSSSPLPRLTPRSSGGVERLQPTNRLQRRGSMKLTLTRREAVLLTTEGN
ncbi:hypothetical protein PAMA_017746 [Pampus argenteus]